MAKHLARIHGTEEDKVNCPFYFKIGACRHADRCSRLHHRPAFSATILIKHIYRHPVREAELRAAAEGAAGAHMGGGLNVEVDREKALEDFLVFFEDMFSELAKFGHLDALHVCDNLGDHMIGHVYAKFSDEEQASDALNVMNGRYYGGRKMEVEFSPVTDFREARCRDFDDGECARGGFCNFMHIKPVPMCLICSLEEDAEVDKRRDEDRRRDKERRERDRVSGSGGGGGSSSASRRERDRDRDRDRERDRRKRSRRDGRDSRDRDRDRDRERDRDRDRRDRDRDRDRERDRDRDSSSKRGRRRSNSEDGGGSGGRGGESPGGKVKREDDGGDGGGGGRGDRSGMKQEDDSKQ
uniref:C3H1-type domain-containing protein n=1 Tax=Odontella aurita TaxID=265563 RepID=A0A7S4N8D0_9STRA